jgi:PAS domain S-box-containing protein
MALRAQGRYARGVEGLAQRLLEHAFDAVVLLEGDGRIRSASAAVRTLLGVATEDLAGRREADLVHEGDRAALASAAAACANSPGRAVHGQLRYRHARGAWVELGWTRVDRRGDPLVGAIVVNLRRAAEPADGQRALAEARDLLEQAQAVAHVGSWVSDVEWEDSLQWSPECYRIFGIPLGKPLKVAEFFAAVHPEDRGAVEKASREAFLEGKPYDIQHRIVRTNGEVRWVHERAHVVRDEQGKPIRMIGTVQDIHARKQAEEDLDRVREQFHAAQRLDAVGRLAGGIAHDFNNLLTVVLTATEWARARLREEDRQIRAVLEEAISASERAASLTRQLLAFGGRQVMQPHVFDLNARVASWEQLISRLVGERIAVEFRPCEGVAAVRADPTQLEQVLLNLVVNARDAMPHGGTLTIETAIADEHVALVVRDTGVGMEKAVADRVFEPFFSTKEPGRGTGLGLATVFGIVKQSGGHVAVSSAPGRGTQFTIMLPRSTEPIADDDAPAEAASRLGGTETILIAEDEPAVRSVVVRGLRGYGYHVLEAAGGEEAIAIAETHGGEIHLVITDVVMPRVGGIEVARRVRELRPGIRVLYLSGHPADAFDDVALANAEDFVAKPVDAAQLAGRVRRALDSRP